MKTLTIGRSAASDIVANDVTVSAQHAVITVADSGEVRLKDLNSTNGTCVNGRRISAETVITASDAVKVGSYTVDWVKYLNESKNRPSPMPVRDVPNTRRKKTVGRTASNDIVMPHSDVSSLHAQLVETESGEIVIVDCNSSNGTYVNGRKTDMHTLRHCDMVLIANKYMLQWENVFDKKPERGQKRKRAGLVSITVAAAAVAAVVIGLLFVLKPREEKPWPPEKIYAAYKKSVVMIAVAYYYEASIGKDLEGRYVVRDGKILEYNGQNSMGGTGTGFFVSNDGKIVTNRHIVCPWEDDEMEAVRKNVQIKIAMSAKIIDRKDKVASAVLETYTGDVKVEGRLTGMMIFLNDTHTYGSGIPCTVLKESGNDHIDIGVIQTSSHDLPPGVSTVVDLATAVIDDAVIEVGKPVYTIGFPTGDFLASTSQGIEANNQDGKITQTRGEYEFGHNINILGGASGSPVFNEYGRLIGVIHRGLSSSQGFNMAMKAKYAAELAK
ncbi:MAG: FHA domain-containing protein [Tannerella sp.]|jgi:pSer/pThr/pTyr-binding forkhead associated (FHA) protein/S1-C subfamily serine protease|nr:FHA domain-containing protein [Tannerella sp.]